MNDQRLACLEWLLAHGADPEAPGAWPAMRAVLVAAFAGAGAYVECLLRHGAEVDLVVRCALARGADAHAALASAAWKQDLRFAEAALAAGADPDRARRDGRAVLNELVRWGQVAPALWLLERGASPNVPDERGWTALHQAASRGSERLVRACLEHGADAGLRAADGSTALDLALDRRRVKIATLLKDRAPRKRR